jgi:hypothetical protein
MCAIGSMCGCYLSYFHMYIGCFVNINISHAHSYTQVLLKLPSRQLIDDDAIRVEGDQDAPQSFTFPPDRIGNTRVCVCVFIKCVWGMAFVYLLDQMGVA